MPCKFWELIEIFCSLGSILLVFILFSFFAVFVLPKYDPILLGFAFISIPEALTSPSRFDAFIESSPSKLFWSISPSTSIGLPSISTAGVLGLPKHEPKPDDFFVLPSTSLSPSTLGFRIEISPCTLVSCSDDNSYDALKFSLFEVSLLSSYFDFFPNLNPNALFSFFFDLFLLLRSPGLSISFLISFDSSGNSSDKSIFFFPKQLVVLLLCFFLGLSSSIIDFGGFILLLEDDV